MSGSRINSNAYKKHLVTIPVTINTAIFISLSLLHFYWAFGGKYWFQNALPTNSKGLRLINPGPAACLLIAGGLLFFAFITAVNGQDRSAVGLRKFVRTWMLIIAIIFLARAIGDFRFLGFFKTVKTTRFGTLDTRIYSPLCLFVSGLSLLIFLVSGGSRGKVSGITKDPTNTR